MAARPHSTVIESFFPANAEPGVYLHELADASV
jgi:hypothetical protein